VLPWLEISLGLLSEDRGGGKALALIGIVGFAGGGRLDGLGWVTRPHQRGAWRNPQSSATIRSGVRDAEGWDATRRAA